MSDLQSPEIPPPSLEQFKGTQFENTYWIKDQSVIQALTDYYITNKKTYGLEVGFGIEPTRVGLIAPDIDWFFVDPKGFSDAKDILDQVWEEEDCPKENKYFLPIGASPGLVQNAQTVLYRNLNYNRMGELVPKRDELRPGQEIVFVIDTTHVSELDEYKDFLKSKGYDTNDLEQNTGRAFSAARTNNDIGYLFRYKQPEESTD
ncbi:hypothetical protein HY469_00450 [Candidatus Roizmanbacteria bacterium]|nr:hypothetical protein [Candidatus Roizmanbacteria bacterium]